MQVTLLNQEAEKGPRAAWSALTTQLETWERAWLMAKQTRALTVHEEHGG